MIETSPSMRDESPDSIDIEPDFARPEMFDPSRPERIFLATFPMNTKNTPETPEQIRFHEQMTMEFKQKISNTDQATKNRLFHLFRQCIRRQTLSAEDETWLAQIVKKLETEK